MIFEEKIAKKQEDMISLAIEISENKADDIYIYIYGSYEAEIPSFNCFFVKRNKVYTINKLPQIGVETLTEERMFSFLKIGTEDLKDFVNLFKMDGKEPPTQIKLIYDNIHKKARAKYAYEVFHANSETVTPEELFLKWIEEVKAEIAR